LGKVEGPTALDFGAGDKEQKKYFCRGYFLKNKRPFSIGFQADPRVFNIDNRRRRLHQTIPEGHGYLGRSSPT
jgi:hypothetical protein